MIQLIGTIQEIQETKTYPKKDGSGNIHITKLKIDNKYFTSFKKEEVDALNVGMKVEVVYTEKKNEFEGKTYTNNNITSIQPYVGEPKELPAEKVNAVKETLSNPNSTSEDVKKIFEQGIAFIDLYGERYKITLEKQ